MVSTFEFSGNVVGMMVNADIDEAKLKEIHNKIKARFADHKKLNLFIEVEKGADIPLHIIIKDLYFKVKHAGQFNKIAVVTESTKFTYSSKLKGLLLDAEVLTFTQEERLQAMNWIAH
ncbi:STAS/SEC14 domain-containing protein [Antarcticibacterium sp. 1MA-6-2]|uniref:STAS/SEC14 domain-containing protein n=1 Tax=Antarcticibacterium sp. 1MA-6-2 TaxID=2908210 RepID=UPI001F23760B|nr:STAS/SEC14 domain-containing protein [Antarcticibacterium sp. 1MA-6-2]UJH90925.1 STAS/SEC14 domain-containing protein [Antarcticibacterium sp. 1MA-6-2]